MNRFSASLFRRSIPLLLVLLLPLLAACQSATVTVYVNTGDDMQTVEIDLADYEKSPSFFDILKQDDTLEADLDLTNEPRLLSVCNVRAGAEEAYRLFSSNAADAASGAAPVTYKGITFYPVKNMFELAVIADTSYLLVLTSVA